MQDHQHERKYDCRYDCRDRDADWKLKFGFTKRDILSEGFQDQFNTYKVPILTRDAYYKDVIETLDNSVDAPNFMALLKEQRDARLADLHKRCLDISTYTLCRPKVFNLPSDRNKWAAALDLFNNSSFNSFVHLFETMIGMRGGAWEISPRGDWKFVNSWKGTLSREETKKPGTKEPGTKEPGTKEPGTKEPGTKEPGTKEPGTKEPGTQEPGTQEPPDLSPVVAKPKRKTRWFLRRAQPIKLRTEPGLTPEPTLAMEVTPEVEQLPTANVKLTADHTPTARPPVTQSPTETQRIHHQNPEPRRSRRLGEKAANFAAEATARAQRAKSGSGAIPKASDGWEASARSTTATHDRKSPVMQQATKGGRVTKVRRKR